MLNKSIIQTEEDKLKWRLSLSYKQRYLNAMRLIKLIYKLKQAPKTN
jgi:hypothetical protein